MHKHNLEHVHFSSLSVNYCYYSYSLRRNISFWQPTIENEYAVQAKLSSIYQNPVPANDGVITIYVHYHSSLLFPSSKYEQEVKKYNKSQVLFIPHSSLYQHHKQKPICIL